MTKIPTLQKLLEAGVHFGHQSRRWNPKMKPYIFSQQSGIHVIDLEKTEKALSEAAKFIKEVSAAGRTVIFLATKKQTAEIVKEEAKRVEAMYLTHRWIGGLLTNFDTVKKTLEKLSDLETKYNNKESGLTKRELLFLKRGIDKMERTLGGVRNLNRLPDAIFIVDARKEDNAVKEARKMNIPVVALVDTNADPTGVDYPIPANDDAIKSVSLLVKTIANAYEEGKRIWEKKSADNAKKAEASREKITETATT
ncbi:MAG: 30S ribosomal protein S2 [bacterium]|nr:30S ribosomal protein S2 [bacterium]